MQIIALLSHQYSYDNEYESCDIRGDTSKECVGLNHKTTKKIHEMGRILGKAKDTFLEKNIGFEFKKR